MMNSAWTNTTGTGRGSLAKAAAGLLLALGLAFPSLSGSAEAATLTFNVDGKWTEVEGGERVAGLGTNRLSWGGLSQKRRSEYVFDGLNRNVDVPVPTTVPKPVDLGIFTHRNYRIPSGSGIDRATLGVHVNVSSDGTSEAVPPLFFSLDHWETDNRANPCANGEPNRQGVNANGCADRIEFTSNPFDTASLTVNGILYNVRVLGFFNPATNEKLGQYWTKEENDNIAVLRGEVTAVPVPAAGLLLIGGLGGLGFFAVRRRR